MNRRTGTNGSVARSWPAGRRGAAEALVCRLACDARPSSAGPALVRGLRAGPGRRTAADADPPTRASCEALDAAGAPRTAARPIRGHSAGRTSSERGDSVPGTAPGRHGRRRRDRGDRATLQNQLLNARAQAEKHVPWRLYLTPRLDRYVDFHLSYLIAWRQEAEDGAPGRVHRLAAGLRPTRPSRSPTGWSSETTVGPSFADVPRRRADRRLPRPVRLGRARHGVTSPPRSEASRGPARNAGGKPGTGAGAESDGGAVIVAAAPLGRHLTGHRGTPGRRSFAKASRGPDDHRELLREAAVYEVVRDRCPATAGAPAARRALGRRRRRARDGGASRPATSGASWRATATLEPAVAAEVGRVVGEFHAEAGDLGDDDAPPSVWLRGGIGVDRPTPAYLRLLSGGEVGLLRALQRSEELQAHLAALAPPGAGDARPRGPAMGERARRARARAASCVARRLGDGRLRGTGVGRRLLRGRRASARGWPRSPPFRTSRRPGWWPRRGCRWTRSCPDWTPSGPRIAPPAPRADRRLGDAVRAARRRAARAPGLRSQRSRGGPPPLGRGPPAGRDAHPRPTRPAPAASSWGSHDNDDPAAVRAARPSSSRSRPSRSGRPRATRGWGSVAELPGPCRAPGRPAGHAAGARRRASGRGSTTPSTRRARPARRRSRAPRTWAACGRCRTTSPPPTRAPAAWSRGGGSSGRRTGAGSSSGTVCGSG